MSFPIEGLVYRTDVVDVVPDDVSKFQYIYKNN